MHLQSLQKQFHDFIKAHRLVADEDKVLLAVSGGVDSMVMMHLFKQTDTHFGVAHCNFGLRGEDSDKDESLVQTYTRANGILFHGKRIVIEGDSVQLEAREKRYEWFGELMKAHGYTKLATAHHLDDSLETTLLHLVRGTGIRGLRGIPLMQEKTIRPLLFATKKRLVKYAEEGGLTWREDVTNARATYDRNKLRLEVVPILAQLNPSLIATYKGTKERIQMADDMVADRVSDILSRYYEKERGVLSLAWMEGRSYDLLLLTEILSAYGFNFKTVKEIYAARGKSGKRFPNDHHEVVMDRDALYIKKMGGEASAPMLEIIGEGQYSFSAFIFTLQQIKNIQNLDQGTDIALLSASKVHFPVRVRRWTKGDTFVPLGMSGRKKVSDFLIDEKVPLAIKEKVMVVEVAHEIAWVVGYRVSDHFKAEKNKPVFQISVKPADGDYF